MYINQIHINMTVSSLGIETTTHFNAFIEST